MVRITKTFPGVVANEDVNLDIERGEIHALLGENGAGKTTLMNVLYGLYEPNGGEIRWQGKSVRITNPNDAIKLGIGMVHQHFMLVQPMTVAENIVLGAEPRRHGLLDLKAARQRVAELSEQFGLKVDPDARIHSISVGQQQRVEILKALYRGAELLILDEPTAVLTPQEVGELIEIMRRLTSEGRSIIFITHKLKEVLRVADRVTVLRRGRLIDTLLTREADEEGLAEKMVGRKVVLRVEKGDVQVGDVVLEVRGLEAQNSRRLPALRGCSFEVRRGEIYGLAGVDGNGQSELIEVLTGLRPAGGGAALLNGKSLLGLRPRAVAERGVGHIPEDRQRRGLVLNFTVAENIILGSQHKKPFSIGGMMQGGTVERYANDLIARYDIRTPGTKTLARALSGGNQQKLIAARELERDPDLLIAAQPTRGLDVGAIEFLHRRIVEARDRGKAVLLISFELDEIMSLSDRIGVIYEGRIVAEVPGGEASEEQLGLWMAGAAGNRAHEAV
ncbi:MAG: ABC transporter ATP-binding protein [Symbiobacteriia bacterium]